MTKNNTIVILSYYHFPCNHPVLENVFAKELGKELNIIWLLQGAVKGGRRHRWHNSEVQLTKAMKGKGLLNSIFNKILGFNIIFQLIKLITKNKIKIVMIRDLPITGFLMSFLKPFYDFKLYYQYSAPLSDISIGYYKIKMGLGRFYYLFRGMIDSYFTKMAIKKSDIVFPISEFHKNELLSIIDKEKLVPLTMGVDTDWLKKRKEKIPFLEKIAKNGFIVAYFGTLNFNRNPQFILKVFEGVKRKCHNCKFILMGRASCQKEEQELRQICRKLGIEKDVIFTGQLSRDHLKDYLEYCDISISAIPPKSYYVNSSPTKIYESLGNGVPVAANLGIYEQEKVIEESEAGVLIEYDVDLFIDGIVKLLNNTELREKMSINGKEYVNKKYTYKKISKSISQYFH
jgi:glycosyltransferase involved in cell wall biosynthesis